MRPAGDLPTQMGENRPSPNSRFDLTRLRPGQVLEITTGRSTYWVTGTQHTMISASHQVRGIAVQSNSTSFGHVTTSPWNTTCDREVVIGEVFHVGRRSNTGSVRSFRVL